MGTESDRPRRTPPVSLVVLASVVPGLGHLLAGRTRTGAALLAAAGASVAAGAYAAGAVTVEQVLVRPGLLVAVAAALLVVAALWSAAICSAYRAVAPVGQTWGRRLRARVLVLAVCLGVSAPVTVGAQQVHAAAQALEVFATEAPAKGRKPFAGKKRVNLVLLGGDAGSNRRGTRADVIVIASIDTVTGRTTLISLPRNLQNVPLRPGTRLARAYPRGFKDFWFGLYTAVESNPKLWPGVPAKHAAAAAMADTAGYLTKLKVHHYAVVDMAGFRRLVDALGGVTMNVRSGNGRPIPIGGSTNANGSVKSRPHGQIALGKQHLGGYKSMWYVRSRFNSGDGERQARQRCFLTALARQAEPTSVAKTVRRFTAASRQILVTNVSTADLADYVALARKKARKARIERVTILDVVGSSIHPNIGAIRARANAAVAGDAKPSAYRDHGAKRRIC
ncbi:MAG: LCP family protein [Sporichthyaceae bacterium]